MNSSSNSEQAAWDRTLSTDQPDRLSDGRLVSFSMPVQDLSPFDFLDHGKGKPRFYWQQGNSDDFSAGFGMAVQLMAWGESRFAEIRRKTQALFAAARVLGTDQNPVLPRLFGGFAFNDDFAPDNTWASFHPAHFVLPHYQLIKRGQESWLTINAFVSHADDLAIISSQLHQALKERYQVIRANTASGSSGRGATADLNIRFPMSYATWSELVSQAAQQIDERNLAKVVLARVCELRSPQRIDVLRALRFLDEQYEGCTRFLFEPRPYHAFYGATPEVLVHRSGRQIGTMALAGSMARGRTELEDHARARQLLASAKERHEHQLVVNAIRRRLEPITSNLDVRPEPDIYRLSYIQHLWTPIHGQLRDDDTDILHLVRLLHPTPAMGGSPRDQALKFIRLYEPVPRGWYAAPVGWIDNHLDGEFVVAIRSAVTQERRVWCYAGAGIVADSRPDVEWEETRLKLEPMLRALGIDQYQADDSREPLGSYRSE